MNDVIKSGNIIKKIRDGKQLEEIALFARNCIFRDGPKDTLVLEILSYLKLFQPTFFEKFEDELIETMGLFFKNPSPDTLQGVVFDMYRQHIKKKYALFYNSEMLEKLSLGIVTHHGSMPLAARLILEHFTQSGFCRICFATSTLEQGINMPFDVVYLAITIFQIRI